MTDRSLVADERPVDVDVDSDAIELVALDSPVDIEVDNEVTALFVVDKPVDNELMPVDVDVDKRLTAVLVANNCEPLTASVLVAETRPAATFVT